MIGQFAFGGGQQNTSGSASLFLRAMTGVYTVSVGEAEVVTERTKSG